MSEKSIGFDCELGKTGLLCPACNKELCVGDVLNKNHLSIIAQRDDLLAACEAGVKYLNQPQDSDLGNVEIIALLQAAIAKATEYKNI